MVLPASTVARAMLVRAIRAQLKDQLKIDWKYLPGGGDGGRVVSGTGDYLI